MSAPVWLVAGAFALFIVSWLVATPPGEGPDEQAHFIKAVAVGRGEIKGEPGEFAIGPGFGPRQLEWINRNARSFYMPKGLVPDGLTCAAEKMRHSAACVRDAFFIRDGERRLTYVGTYQPYLYAPPGLAIRATGAHGFRALYVARATDAAICIALLAAAAALLWNPAKPGLSLVGLVLATTPTVLFLASALSANGPEICAGICFVAAMLRFSRPARLPAWGWVALAASGAVLATARSLGPGYLALEAAIPVLLLGPREAWARVRAAGRWATVSGVVLVVAAAAGAGWELTQQPHPPTELGQALRLIGPALTAIPSLILHQEIGSFGWNETRLPNMAVALWAAAGLVVVVLAWVAGRRRDHAVIGTVIAGALAVSVGVYITVAHTNFPMQGRYVLPLVVAVPLVAGELLMRNWERVNAPKADRLFACLVVLVTPIHVIGWLAFARRSAVGNRGPLAFFGNSDWHPPLGWAPPTLLLLIAALMLLGAGALTLPSLRR